LLALANLRTVVLMKASNSSTDSGRGSAGAALGAEAGGGAGVAVAGVEEVGVEADCGEATLWCRAGTPCGSSMLDVAMSSSREVAASSLAKKSAGRSIVSILSLCMRVSRA
jgi:hypothetical protein